MMAAEKGLTEADVDMLDCLCEPDELREEAEMLGLNVISCERNSLLHTQHNWIKLKVSWTKDAPPNAPPSGLDAGNMTGECKVCFETETLCRLHPCGHLLGARCARSLATCP